MIRALLDALKPTTRHSLPQSMALPSRVPQVANSAGGYVWAIDAFARLERFLILGSEGGSYYASPKALTAESCTSALEALSADGPRAVALVVAVSTSGRAPRNDAAILCLALALKLGDGPTRDAAIAAVPRVCRTGAHLFAFAAAVDSLGGWGRATRRAFSTWYCREDLSTLALQAIKYPQREGWSHRDLLRKSHPTPPSNGHDALFRWICTGSLPATGGAAALQRLHAATALSQASSLSQATALIRAHDLPRECVPTALLAEPELWLALLESGAGMPLTALLRNLAKMTVVGLLAPGHAATAQVCSRLTDPAALRRARLHPLTVLVALNTYRHGKGLKGKLGWVPVPEIVAALERSFLLCFDAIPATGLRWKLAVDVSGSMGWGEIAGMTGITPRVGAAAMVMATLRSEREAQVVAFSDRLVPVSIGRDRSLTEVMERFDQIPMGGTDCAAPIVQAIDRHEAVDCFVVYTDSETWAGGEHPAAALWRYRQQSGIAAKLVVVGMVSNGFSIADPGDPGMLDVVGFDTQAPALMADFARSAPQRGR